ncbi:coagulation factor 5/8 type domain-containing protein [Xylella taiwanensis]|nr:discoidin domain-containing protein [Xylella taiwanensis]AXI83200.1 coagulation factor 5/8 type domain-containing protein [Xylella taiwanensis]MCD8456252.1 discoidin domain-containing protein [Xylella taiwanensis]MCD8458660.1 discoidin domain-containing protein [Xylella taiwanensis]MCD8460795.1 discoidin domain-containing protein [Xylella taiwanensis]MCD8463147.1 discoidin domain-containing protein [Xylella taiwanensis]
MIQILSVVVACIWICAAQAEQEQILDEFEDVSSWKLVLSDHVSGTLRQVAVASGGYALCLDYNFNGVSGDVGIRRELPIQYSENYQFSFLVRGDAPANDLQLKLLDVSGDNVWWVNRTKFEAPPNWTLVSYRKRHIEKAWGPDTDKTLRRSAQIEFNVHNSVGGRGSICFDRLALKALPSPDTSPLTAAAITDTAPALEHRLIDGRLDTFWLSSGIKQQTVTLDMGRPREIGGAVIDWVPGLQATRYTVRGSIDGRRWKVLRNVIAGTYPTHWLALPETEARYVRFDLQDGPNWRYGIKEIHLQPLAFAATPNDFIKSLASLWPRGSFPRGFSGEQSYWTILGLDGGSEQGLINTDGAIEATKSGFSIEPFVVMDGNRLLRWSDVSSEQSLQEGYLPIPRVEWRHDQVNLQVTAFVQGTPEQAQVVARYQLRNTSKQARDFALALAVRPFQVNPPSQFLNTPGGISRIDQLVFNGTQVSVNGKPRVFTSRAPDAAFATSFDAGMDVVHLAQAPLPHTTQVNDDSGLASGVMLFRWHLQPNEIREIAVLIPQNGSPGWSSGFDAKQAQQQVAQMWHDKLDLVRIEVPTEGRPIVDTLRTAMSHMLISRDGSSLQPGTRSYSRSWIRDGAMISEALLRLGREDVVRDYINWFSPYQFANGMVPCCVDHRGSDPVPENDSHGELIYTIGAYYRYTGDRDFLAAMWPHVNAAAAYMDTLRLSERTEAHFMRDPAFYGMMPASISHEGYSAKPVHAYWDNFWALRGYEDAAHLASVLDKPEDAVRLSASRDEFAADLSASLRSTVRNHGIDYLPGSAEHGDFDATSTAVALALEGERSLLPQDLLANTFERYWTQFVERRDGKRKWKDYTPYEWRNVSAFVRLDWRNRVWDAATFFLRDRAPPAWNQWAEVVSHTPNVPFFVGDLPHAWVASDFVRSVLDMFAYTRESDASLVIAAGVPVHWFGGEGVALHDLRTPHGRLSYRIQGSEKQLRIELKSGLLMPSGGVVFRWPYAGVPGASRINGEVAAWQGRELRILRLPATVEIDMPAATLHRTERVGP